MSYVDRKIDNPEHRLCEDIPRFCDGVSNLLREVVNAAVDAVVFSVLLRRYSRTHKYTLAILGYVLGAGVLTVTFQPNFSRMNRKQQELEGAPLAAGWHLCMQVDLHHSLDWECSGSACSVALQLQIRVCHRRKACSCSRAEPLCCASGRQHVSWLLQKSYVTLQVPHTVLYQAAAAQAAVKHDGPDSAHAPC